MKLLSDLAELLILCAKNQCSLFGYNENEFSQNIHFSILFYNNCFYRDMFSKSNYLISA